MDGLLKKAMELSILCDCEIALVVLNNGTEKLVEYSSSKMDTVLSRFQQHRSLPHETHGNENLYRKYADGNGEQNLVSSGRV
ncbi:hypothetical protein BSKO_11922 [Bryopsis sp. KO-2023]|nr:hypothetical protein BSKO_11922 [Bryopsis sp. KO-2023]